MLYARLLHKQLNKYGRSSYSEVEGVCLLAELFEKALLQAAEWFALLRQGGESLEGGDVKVLSEGQSQHIQVLSAITKCTRQSHKHWPGSEERGNGFKQTKQDANQGMPERNI